MYKVLIVDDHEIVRIGLKQHLTRDDRIEQVDEAADGESAINKAKEGNYDVIIMDIRLPDKSGVKACEEIMNNNPEANVVMLTAYSDDDALIESILAGASGYLLKEVKAKSLVDTVVKAAMGQPLLSNEITQKVMERLQEKNENKRKKTSERLSPREFNILELVSEGKTNKEIGEKLYISEKTVRNQLSSIMSKLDLSNRAQAAAFYASELKDKNS
ncbi:response regulator transcription factor [Natranaerofaba carboxydovora]|uniref:response regulator transcription factor n=1 Tax=Natranaerofaba carboxydovora TaxID=2742683 RepID=UPI001F130CCA|nr:response regulator transcription factor [Natranaerofaba carboxydovora]UMZ74807.1 Transcriptional regulatory protein LiaR [Natranaerofaba carboxydovora]